MELTVTSGDFMVLTPQLFWNKSPVADVWFTVSDANGNLLDSAEYDSFAPTPLFFHVPAVSFMTDMVLTVKAYKLSIEVADSTVTLHIQPFSDPAAFAKWVVSSGLGFAGVLVAVAAFLIPFVARSRGSDSCLVFSVSEPPKKLRGTATHGKDEPSGVSTTLATVTFWNAGNAPLESKDTVPEGQIRIRHREGTLISITEAGMPDASLIQPQNQSGAGVLSSSFSFECWDPGAKVELTLVSRTSSDPRFSIPSWVNGEKPVRRVTPVSLPLHAYAILASAVAFPSIVILTSIAYEWAGTTTSFGYNVALLSLFSLTVGAGLVWTLIRLLIATAPLRHAPNPDGLKYRTTGPDKVHSISGSSTEIVP